MVPSCVPQILIQHECCYGILCVNAHDCIAHSSVPRSRCRAIRPQLLAGAGGGMISTWDVIALNKRSVHDGVVGEPSPPAQQVSFQNHSDRSKSHGRELAQ